MDIGGPIIAAIIGGIGTISALAYKHDRKWPTFHKSVLAFATFIGRDALGFACALYVAKIFPEEIGQMALWATCVFVACIAIAAIVSMADWLRKP